MKDRQGGTMFVCCVKQGGIFSSGSLFDILAEEERNMGQQYGKEDSFPEGRFLAKNVHLYT